MANLAKFRKLLTMLTGKSMQKNSNKYTYYFGGAGTEGASSMRNLLGGKGANLAEMARVGINVPPGFTITTEVCTYHTKHNSQYPPGLKEEVATMIKRLENSIGKKFGDPANPLLLSVRSGARISMPGMMDTVLNLGLNDESVEGLSKITQNPRFAFDSYRRFIQMYGDVVLGLKPATKLEIDPFEKILDSVKEEYSVKTDNEMNLEAIQKLIVLYKKEILEKTGSEFPQEPMEQLWSSINAVFASWMNERAQVYREINHIPSHWGTAVNVQTMVFGNKGSSSGTGVAFTRDPATGENSFYGEYLFNAQGEDVVAGIRTPSPVSMLEKDDPHSYQELLTIRTTLEHHFKEMMDIEFTIQEGKLWILQARVGKRTGFAAIKIAVDMVREGLISKEEAIIRIDPLQLNQLLRPVFSIDEKRTAIKEGRLMTKGLNAGPGAACGKAVFSAPDAVEMARQGDPVILIRIETSPEDIRGLNAADGILTARGGMTSHAALVARQMGKVCVAGASELLIDYSKKEMVVRKEDKEFLVKEGDYLSLDGTTGEILEGKLETRPSDVLRALFQNEPSKSDDSPMFKAYSDLMRWADSIRKLSIRANADQPDQASTAIAFGAEGIGLCRTEHMFFGGKRIHNVRQMILAENDEERQKALHELLQDQRQDFKELLRTMDGKPVIIRTLDPPLHEFLPKTAPEIKELAQSLGRTVDHISERIAQMEETNPMLGLRGCRLGILHPEITQMQARAIFEAAADLKAEGFHPKPEIMIPLVSNHTELTLQANIVRETAENIFKEKKVTLDIIIGTMIELPRAALTANEIAHKADFFSFGTNDLTQTTFGISRDDSAEFLPLYIEKQILEKDPFATLDQNGVGELIKIATIKGRKVRPNLEIGICGEHGGDPDSIEFCHANGLDYVSCSPYRLPIARLAAARAALKNMDN